MWFLFFYYNKLILSFRKKIVIFLINRNQWRVFNPSFLIIFPQNIKDCNDQKSSTLNSLRHILKFFHLQEFNDSTRRSLILQPIFLCSNKMKIRILTSILVRRKTYLRRKKKICVISTRSVISSNNSRNVLHKIDDLTRLTKRSKYSSTAHHSLLHLPCAAKKKKKKNSIDGERRSAVKLRVVTRTTGEGWTGSSASLHRERRPRVAKRKGGQAGAGVHIRGIGRYREFRRDGVSAESSRGQHLRVAVHPRYRWDTWDLSSASPHDDADGDDDSFAQCEKSRISDLIATH